MGETCAALALRGCGFADPECSKGQRNADRNVVQRIRTDAVAVDQEMDLHGLAWNVSKPHPVFDIVDPHRLVQGCADLVASAPHSMRTVIARAFCATLASDRLVLVMAIGSSVGSPV